MPSAATAPSTGAAKPRPTVVRVARIAASLAPLVSVHAALLAIPFVPFSWVSLVLFFVVTRIVGIGVTVGLHRYFSHRSFKTTRWFQFLLGCAGCTSLQNGPLWWVAHHRLHHKHSDHEGDPHSPVKDGFWYGHVGWLFANDLMDPDMTPVRDFTKYPELRLLDRIWVVPGLMLAGVCYLIDGWSGVVWGYCLGVVAVFQITFAVNSIGHLFGPQRFQTGEGSRNNLILGYLAMGDGWHNNHHRMPSSARHGLAWYELDMSYNTIKLFQRLGLVWGVKEPPASLLPKKGNNVPAESPALTQTAS